MMLFIGGPWDNREEDIPNNLHYVVVTDCSCDLDMLHKYFMEMVFLPGNNRLFFLRHESLETKEATRILASRFHPNMLKSKEGASSSTKQLKHSHD